MSSMILFNTHAGVLDFEFGGIRGTSSIIQESEDIMHNPYNGESGEILSNSELGMMSLYLIISC